MTKPLPLGLYEQVVNVVLHEKLEALTAHATPSLHLHKDKLDPVTSRDVLAYYLAGIIKEVLTALDRKDHEIEDRVAFCNELLRYMASYMASQNKPDIDLIKRLDQYWIRKEGEMLLAIAEQQTALNPNPQTKYEKGFNVKSA